MRKRHPTTKFLVLKYAKRSTPEEDKKKVERKRKKKKRKGRKKKERKEKRKKEKKKEGKNKLNFPCEKKKNGTNNKISGFKIRKTKHTRGR